MRKFDDTKIDKLIQHYKNNLSVINDEYNNELFKWEALKQFQDVWFGDKYNAVPIADKLKKALSKTSSLLTTQWERYKDCLLDAFQFEPERVSTALDRLFTHTDDLNERENNLYHFSAEIEAVKAVHFPSAKLEMFTPYAASVLLSLYAPAENYILKKSKADLCCECLEFYQDVSFDGQVRVIPYYEMCDAVLEQLLSKKNHGLLDEHDKLIKERGYYLDESRHWLVYDIIFSCDEKFKIDVNPASREEVRKKYKQESDRLKIQSRMDELKEQIYEIENRYDFKGTEVIHPVYGFGVASKLMIRKGLDLLEIDFSEVGIKMIGLVSSCKMKLNTPDAEQIYKDFDECYQMKEEYERLNVKKNAGFTV